LAPRRISLLDHFGYEMLLAEIVGEPLPMLRFVSK
jgi:hypothetical protein